MCTAWYEVRWPKKVVLCLHLLVPVLAIRTTSNCWLPAMNVAVGHRLLYIVQGAWSFRPCEKQLHVDLHLLAWHLQT